MHRHIEAYSHQSRIGVLVELETRDDFTARTDEFKHLARDIALHIAASNPVGIEPIDERSLARQWANTAATGINDAVLLEQPFIKDESMTIRERIILTEHALKAPVRIVRFVRFATDET
ncbi:MAG: hypothetical protein QNJ40_14625 [Xanthomonadales bacterium]|nr:hypothetical protein [Xanthomonadales bacterium]